MERIEQLLIELLADFLDSDEVHTQQILDGDFDPESREETELHIRMAKAAMIEYKNTVTPDKITATLKPGISKEEVKKRFAEMEKEGKFYNK